MGGGTMAITRAMGSGTTAIIHIPSSVAPANVVVVVVGAGARTRA
jgi:vacuolar-type H+-ATPase catalytic subunit A/Vma1